MEKRFHMLTKRFKSRDYITEEGLGKRVLALVRTDVFNSFPKMECHYSGGWDMHWNNKISSMEELEAYVQSDDAEWSVEYYLLGTHDGKTLYLILDTCGEVKMSCPDDLDFDPVPTLRSLGYRHCRETDCRAGNQIDCYPVDGI